MRSLVWKLVPALALTATLVVGGTACKKDGAVGGGGTGGSSDAADLGYLPADAMVVAGINAKQLQSSALWKTKVEPQLVKGDAATKLAEFKARCGFDPIASITSVSVGAKGMTGRTVDAVVVLRGLDKAKTFDCLEKSKADLATQGTTVARDGDVVTLTADGQPVIMTFAGDVALIGSGAYATKDAITLAAAGNSQLKSSPNFVDMYNKLDTSKSIWFFVSGKLSAFEAASSMLGSRPKSVFGALNVTDGLAVDARVRLESDAKAAELAKTFQSQIEGVKAYSQQAALTSEGPDLRLTLQMSEANMQELAKSMGPMLGMMMGGM